jgi:hypothetical protein
MKIVFHDAAEEALYRKDLDNEMMAPEHAPPDFVTVRRNDEGCLEIVLKLESLTIFPPELPPTSDSFELVVQLATHMADGILSNGNMIKLAMREFKSQK